MNAANDTIVALSTPSGESALALIRTSGSLSPELCLAALGRRTLPRPRTATYSPYQDRTGEVLDEVVILFYPEGNSFTGESMLEITSHGNPVIISKIIEDCVQRGARIAEPGEFSRRAFLNGKLDLTQAEAIADLIHARSDLALRVAGNQLRGSIGHWVSRSCDTLLESIASLEAYIDFPEEDLPPEDKEGPLKSIHAILYDIDNTLDTSNYRDIIQSGIKTIILGTPNAGKSSLINKLVGENRVLVSPDPGTTRDYIREQFRFGPHSIQIMDTAGIRSTEETLEKQGVEKTLELAQKADFFLLVLDTNAPDPLFPASLTDLLHSRNCLIIENKIDLPESRSMEQFYPEYPHVRISLKENTGWEHFRNLWLDLLQDNTFTPPSETILVNARHAAALRQARKYLEEGLKLARSGESVEWVVAEFRAALDAFGEVIGKVDNEAILDILFKNFCIGK